MLTSAAMSDSASRASVRMSVAVPAEGNGGSDKDDAVAAAAAAAASSTASTASTASSALLSLLSASLLLSITSTVTVVELLGVFLRGIRIIFFRADGDAEEAGGLEVPGCSGTS
jgi:hypothetical protein